MKLSIVLAIASLAFVSCKKSPGASGGEGSEVSSVAIQVPAQVNGKVNKARLTGNTASLGKDRKFEETIVAGANGAGSVISFQRDTANENLKTGDNLFTVTLELLNGDKVVYTGTGDKTPFQISAGENRISFNLSCQDPTICPTGSNLQVLNVPGVAANPANAPKILADIKINSTGTNEAQRRQLVAGCQTQIKKQPCAQWDAQVANGSAKCTKILAGDPNTACDGDGTFSTCLNDYIKLCQEMGVISK